MSTFSFSPNLRIFRYVFLIFVVLLGVFLVMYHIPLHRTINSVLSNELEETAEIKLEITINRTLFSNLSIKGMIEFEGKKYVSASFLNDSILSNKKSFSAYFIEKKLQNGGDAIELLKDSIYINQIHFDHFYKSIDFVLLIQKENGISRWWVLK